VTHGTDQQPQEPTPTNAPAPIAHHWIMTVQSVDGRQGTSDGHIDVIPGVHTDETTYSTVLNGMRKWIGSENITVLFYRLSPSAIAAPAVSA
jgi:hypothetical protein